MRLGASETRTLSWENPSEPPVIGYLKISFLFTEAGLNRPYGDGTIDVHGFLAVRYYR